jgi:hypothetical protein
VTRRVLLVVVLVLGAVLAGWQVPAAVSFHAAAATGPSVFPAVAIWAFLNVTLGALLIWRRPGLLYPWLMFGVGLLMVQLEIGALRAHSSDSLYFVAASLPALLAQLFPTGRTVPGVWGWFTYIGALGLAGIATASIWPSHPSPGPVFGVMWAAGQVATFPVVAVRYHQSAGVERAQLKWFLFTVAAAVGLWFAASVVAPHHLGIGTVALVAALSLPVLGIAVSLLRYRLYDIDRVISRTAAYAVVTGLLLAMYGAVAASISAVMGQNSKVAVAAATLIAAALARPILNRVQNVVDRRFNRSRYDAARTVDAFGGRLRDEVDPHHVSDDLVATVSATLQPRHVAVWTRQPA